MTNQSTETAIVGGEMVGGALALGLAQHGFAVMVIEHAEPTPFVVNSQLDVWISATSAASVLLLKGLGVWGAVQAMCCHPYRRLETWEWETAHVVFDAAELKLPLFGYMVENIVLQQALWRALEVYPEVTLHAPGSLIALHRHDDLQELELKGGEMIRARLVTDADGASSQVRQMAGAGVHVWQHVQSYMLISAQCENGPGDSTWQQSTPDGPRAFLPLFNSWVSPVWYDSLARIRQLQDMNMIQFQAEIVKHFLSRLGYVTSLAAGALLLMRRHALRYVQPGPALVGDAAHTIHPLAGQGVDLGYRDIDALTDVSVNARSYGEAWVSYSALKRYQMRRMADNLTMQSGMDLFYVGSNNNLPSLRLMCNLGLMVVERAGVLKRQALRYTLGL